MQQVLSWQQFPAGQHESPEGHKEDPSGQVSSLPKTARGSAVGEQLLLPSIECFERRERAVEKGATAKQ